MEHPSLKDLVIQSTDTLRESHIDMKIPDGWSGTVPVLQGPRGKPETPALLKTVLRKGVPPALRCAIWISNIIQAVHPDQDEEHWFSYRALAKVRSLDHAYENLLQTMITSDGGEMKDGEDVFKVTQRLWRNREVSCFGGHDSVKVEGITEKGQMSLKRVLIALEHVLGIVDHTPILPTLAALFLTCMSESYAFTAIREMAHDTVWFFAISRREHVAFCYAFKHIIHKLHKQTAEYLEDRGVLDLDSLNFIFRDFFAGVLPLPLVQRIMDIFSLEGSKVLFRVGVALFVLYKKEAAEKLVTISNAQEWWNTLRHWAHHRLFNFDVVIRKAYGVHGRLMQTQMRFPSRTILQRIIKAEEFKQAEFGDDEATFQSPPLGLADRVEQIEVTGHVKETVKPILAQPLEVRQSLANWVPISMRLTNLNLLYSTNFHGRSLDIFYERLRNDRHTILLAEVIGGESQSTPTVVGMYASQAWRISSQVYGDGECFLFRASPDPKCWKWRPDASGELELNESGLLAKDAMMHQFMVSQNHFISMGGGDGSTGLRINEDLTVGESSKAAGFGNEPLHGVGKGSVFSIGLVEVFGLVRQIDGKPV